MRAPLIILYIFWSTSILASSNTLDSLGRIKIEETDIKQLKEQALQIKYTKVYDYIRYNLQIIKQAKGKDSIAYADAHFAVGAQLLYLNKWDECMNFAQDISAAPNTLLFAHKSFLIGLCFDRREDLVSAIESSEKALSIYLRHRHPNIVRLYGSFGAYKGTMAFDDEAFYYYDKAHKGIKEYNAYEYEDRININFAYFLRDYTIRSKDLQHIALADSLLNICYNNALEKKDSFFLINTLSLQLWLTPFYPQSSQSTFTKIKRGLSLLSDQISKASTCGFYIYSAEALLQCSDPQLDSALVYVNQGLLLSQKYKLQHQEHHAYDVKSDIYYALKDFENMKIYHEKSDSVYLKFHREDKINKLIKLNAALKLKEATHKAQLTENKHKQLKKALHQLVIIVFLLFIIGIFAFQRYREKKAHIELITKLNTRLSNSIIAINTQKKQLQKTNKELQDINQLKEKIIVRLKNFTAVLAHDIKEPIRSIHSFVQIIERKTQSQLSTDALEYFGYVKTSCSRINKMIDGLRAYSTDTLSFFEAFEAVDLSILLAEVQDNLYAQIKASKATIEIDTLPSIDGQYTMLVQVFQNLISNALKYSKPNTIPHIRIYCKLDNNKVHIYVEDNGMGIKAEEQVQIFQPYKRASNILNIEGDGLGLASCKEFVEIHGGTISINSQYQVGTTVELSFELSSKQASNSKGY